MLRTHTFPYSTARAISATLALVALLAGCGATGGPFVWANDYPVEQTNASAIGVGDLVSISVYGNERISARSRIRNDGRIAVPLIQDVDVAGKTPAVVGAEIEKRLKDADLVLDPHVTVVVEEVRPIAVSMLGKVSRAGTFPLDPNAGLAEALAAAGGLSEFAHKDRIFVLRRTPTPVRIRFTLESITSTQGRGALFRLRNGDIIEVQ